MLLQVHVKKWSKELYFVGVGRLCHSPVLFNRLHLKHNPYLSLQELGNKVGEAMSSVSSLNCKDSISLKFLRKAIHDPNMSRQKIGMQLKWGLSARIYQYFRIVVYKGYQSCSSTYNLNSKIRKECSFTSTYRWLWYRSFTSTYRWLCYPKPEH